MVAAELPSNASLAELLSARARRTPRDRLVLDIIGGILVAAAALWAQPSGWVALAAIGVCFAAYGAWALAELQLLPRQWPEEIRHEAVWRTVQAAATLLGLSAFVLLLFAALGIALGSIKS